LRIAFVSFDFGEYCIRHANALLEFGEVELVLPTAQVRSYEGLIDPRVDFRPFEKPRLRQPLRQIARTRWIVKQVNAFRPDVVHLQKGHMWFNAAIPWLARHPLVMTIHDPVHHVGDRSSAKTPQAVLDFGYRRADRIIVHGRPLKEQLHERLGIERDKIHVIPHIALGFGDDVADLPPGPGPESGSGAREGPKVLFFGRIWAYKGLDYLIRAQPAISARVPDAKFVIAGRGEDFQKYREMMQDPSAFEIHNRWLDDGERTRLFEAADVVVLPYVEATQSGVVPVAYAHSRPVVATATGGLPDIVDHGVTGLLVPPRDSESLAEAITDLLLNVERRRRMGLAGRQKLVEECSAPVVARETVAVYRAAISGSERDPDPAPVPTRVGRS
jgi:glycosyltransferase involved in cell wall biosynthesis